MGAVLQKHGLTKKQKCVVLGHGWSMHPRVGKDDEWVNGCSVLSILSLAASKGTVLRVRAEGEGAERAVAELGALIETDEDVPSKASG